MGGSVGKDITCISIAEGVGGNGECEEDIFGGELIDDRIVEGGCSVEVGNGEDKTIFSYCVCCICRRYFNVEVTDISIGWCTAKGLIGRIEGEPEGQWGAICLSGSVGEDITCINIAEGVSRNGEGKECIFGSGLINNCIVEGGCIVDRIYGNGCRYAIAAKGSTASIHRSINDRPYCFTICGIPGSKVNCRISVRISVRHKAHSVIRLYNHLAEIK